MALYKSIKTKLQANNSLQTLFARYAGTARWAWNWALEICKQAIASQQKFPTAINLHKQLVAAVKPENP